MILPCSEQRNFGKRDDGNGNSAEYRRLSDHGTYTLSDHGTYTLTGIEQRETKSCQVVTGHLA